MKHFSDDMSLPSNPIYDPTEDMDNFRMQLITDERACLLEFQEVGDFEGYRAIGDQYILDADAYMLIYSVAARETFDTMRAEHERITDVRGRRPPSHLSETLHEQWRLSPRILVANKADLEGSLRQVSTEEGRELARELGVEFAEVSARNRDEVMDAVRQIIRASDKWKDELERAVVEARSGLGRSEASKRRRLALLRAWLRKLRSKRVAAAGEEQQFKRRQKRK